nr:GGDEF and EAL domain-containing protein [Pararoseomonas baculiformis]
MIADYPARDPITPPEIWARRLAGQAAGEPFRDFQFSLRQSDGSIRHFQSNGVPVRSEAGVLIGFRGTTRDRTREVEVLHELAHQAMHDTLTGLPNRRSIARELEEITEAGNQPAAVLLLDLDGFKTVNDIHGHAAGDALLRLVAERLRGAVRPDDVAGRLGGDEFAVLLRDVDAARVLEIGQRIVGQLSEPYVLPCGTELRVGVSVGGCLTGEGDADTLLRLADQSLYEAKRRGGNSVRLHGQEAPVQTERRDRAWPEGAAMRQLRSAATVPAALQLALEREELSLDFQPMRRVADGRVEGLEALLRWRSAELGPVSPEVFVPVAEETGLIVPIGLWAIEKACEAAVGGSWRIAVNLSPVQFSQPGLISGIGAILHRTGLQPSRLVLELTERTLTARPGSVREKLRSLRAMGVLLALDDFGTGYSKLASLHDFRFDMVKVDGSVLRIGAPQREPVLCALLDIARAFGAATVVEGVENEAEWRMLGKLGADFAQGRFLGAPRESVAAALAEPAMPGARLPPGVAR